MHWLIADGKNTEINGRTWVDYDLERATRDNAIVHGKVNHLTALINQYFSENQSVA